MNIWVDDTLFAPGAARDVDRLALLRGAFLRHHTLYATSEVGLIGSGRPGPLLSRWVEGLSEGLRREVELLIKGLALISAGSTARGAGTLWVTRRTVRPMPCSGCVLDLDEAIRVVVLPLSVIVEDIINEPAFLMRVMPPVWRERLEQWERRGEVCFEHGAGIESMGRIIKAFATEVAQAAEVASSGGSPGRSAGALSPSGWRLVHFLVFDHDGASEDAPGKSSRGLGRLCDQCGMAGRYHRLERRTQESYLPKQALIDIVEREQSGNDHRATMRTVIEEHFRRPLKDRSFAKPFLSEGSAQFKNAFGKKIEWKDEWFEGPVHEEMTRLAESIAAAM